MTTTDAPHKDYWAKQARKAIAEARAEHAGQWADALRRVRG